MPQPTSTHHRKHITTARARDDDMWDGRDEEPLAGGGRDGAWQPSTRHHSKSFAQFAAVAVAAGATLMFAAIAWALSTSTAAGSNTEQLNWLLANPWGIVSLVDLYVGFSVYSIWIWFREANALVAAAWTAIMMTTGWLGGCLYALNCLRRFNGDWEWFFMGARARG